MKLFSVLKCSANFKLQVAVEIQRECAEIEKAIFGIFLILTLLAYCFMEMHVYPDTAFGGYESKLLGVCLSFGICVEILRRVAVHVACKAEREVLIRVSDEPYSAPMGAAGGKSFSR